MTRNTVIVNAIHRTNWKYWFAWYPVVTVNGERIWLQKCFRRKVFPFWDDMMYHSPDHEYATLFDVIQNS
jgi:hypothetical protein